jgi:thiol-disulfide isomerase/thioredoxin
VLSPSDVKVRLLRALALVLALAIGPAALSGCSRRTPAQKEDSVPRAQEQTKEEQPATADPAPSPGPVNPSVQILGGTALVKKVADSGKKGTIVNAWASWCGPCRREFPMLVALRDNLRAQGMEVVFVSVDEPEAHGAAVARSSGGPPTNWCVFR